MCVLPIINSFSSRLKSKLDSNNNLEKNSGTDNALQISFEILLSLWTAVTS